jgi:hypothetical protein
MKKTLTTFLIIDNFFHSSLIFSTMMMDAIRSSEALVLTRATRRHISEDSILHSHRHENLKSYTIRLLF